MILTHQQLLAEVRRLALLEPQRTDCSIDIVTGYDIDAVLERFMQQWYNHLLDTAHPSLLVPEDASALMPLDIDDQGVVATTVPERVRQLLTLQLDGWRRQAAILDPLSPLAMAQGCLFSRAGVNAPVAVFDVADRSLRLYSLPPGTKYTRWRRAVCILEPEDPQTFVINERALATIPEALKFFLQQQYLDLLR